METSQLLDGHGNAFRGHIVEMTGFVPATFIGDSFDFRPAGAPPPVPTVMKSRQQLLDLFDKNVADARAAIAKASDEELYKTWTLLNGGKTFFPCRASRCFAA